MSQIFNTFDALPILPASRAKLSRQQKVKAGQAIALAVGGSVAVASMMLHDFYLMASLPLALVGAGFSKQFNRMVRKVGMKIKPWQVFFAIIVATIIISGSMMPASAQLFNPLKTETNNVLTAAGAGGASASVGGIFSLMNVIVAIAGVGAVVYGGYQQSQGHTMRESFTPLAVVILVYIGCNFVMRMFLGGGAA